MPQITTSAKMAFAGRIRKKEGPAGWGVTLFMQRGTVAWMKAWPASDVGSAVGGSRPVVEKEACDILADVPAALPREVILVLVDMLVKRCREQAA
jgi:hypothetical protein